MQNHVLQGLCIQPRRSANDPSFQKDHNPRIAKTLETSRSVGDSGILYSLVDREDYSKYKILSDNELRDEYRKSMEMAATLHMTSSRPSSASFSRAGTRYSAPQFGTASRQRKIEAHTWEKEAKGGSGVRTSLSSTVEKLKENSGIRASADNVRSVNRSTSSDVAAEETLPAYHSRREEYADVEDHMDHSHRRHQDNDESMAASMRISTDTVGSVVNALKSKYEQNLHVIDRLYEEKKAMEMKVRRLDMQLARARHTQSASPRGGGNSAAGNGAYDLYASSPSTAVAAAAANASQTVRDIAEEASIRADIEDAILGRKNIPPQGGFEDADEILMGTANITTSFDERPPRPQSAGTSRGGSSDVRRASIGGGGGVAAEVYGAEASSSYQEEDVGSSRRRPPPYSLASQSVDGGGGAWATRGRDQSQSQSQSRYSRSQQNSPARHDGGGVSSRGRRTLGGGRTRSLSASGGEDGRSGSRVRGVSAHLQADQDRFVQRRRAAEAREREKNLEQEMWEAHIRERHFKASQLTKTGGEFTEMKKREDQARLINQHRSEQKKRKEEVYQQQIRDDELRKKNEVKNRPDPFNGLTWAEISAKQEMDRKLSMDSRAQELATRTTAFTPNKGSDGFARAKSKERVFSARPPEPFTAEDPRKVAERLEKQQRIWNDKIEKAKETARRQHTGTKPVGVSGEIHTVDGKTMPVYGTEGMVRRAEESSQRRREKYILQREKEEAETLQRLEEEKKHRERLLNAKIPEEGRRLTKSAEVRASMVRKNIEDKEKAAEKERVILKKKAASEKQASQVLKTIIAMSEEDRKSRNPGFKELTRSDGEVAAQRAAEAREEYRAKLRANKKKIEDSVMNRPSLILRHDQAVAKNRAGSIALSKVADVVLSATGQKGVGRRALDDDDIFSENQKIQLGAKDDYDDEFDM